MTTPDDITLLGSEMLTWSDLAGEAGGFGGLLAPCLVHDFSGARRRVLVAGPTTPEVIVELAGQFESTEVLVRSLQDAESLRADLPSSIAVTCGPLDRLAALGNTYDAVVAAAGTDRLHSAEEATPTTEAVLDDLVRLVGEGGELFLGVGNPVGVDRLLSLDPSNRHQDAAWPDGHSVHGAEPTMASVLDTLVSRHGLTTVESWYCHGPRTAPMVAASSAALVAASDADVLTRVLARAYDSAHAGAPTLKDPTATVRDLTRAGLAAATAPLVVIHVRRGPAAEARQPAILVADSTHESAAVAYRLTPTGAGWRRDLVGSPATLQPREDLTRTTEALNGPIPRGATLAELMLASSAAHDASEIGVLVRRYRDWLGSGPVTGTPLTVLPADLVVTAEGLESLDASWSTSLSASAEVALVRGLLDVADRLVRQGVRHPWNPSATAPQITASLAAAAGLENVEPLVEEARALTSRLTAGAIVDDSEDPLQIRSLPYAELVDVAEGLSVRVAEAEEHIIWLLQRVQSRQRMLRHTRAVAHRISISREMRIGRKVFVVRDKVRRWRSNRALKTSAPAGEWQDNSAQPPQPETVGFTLESHMIPPGYTPPPEVNVVEPLSLEPMPRPKMQGTLPDEGAQQ